MGAGLYIHIPFCASKCSYCNFVSGVYTDDVKRLYVERVLEELGERRREVGAIDTVYIGGGTPGQLPVALCKTLIEGVRATCGTDGVKEFTFETNPESVTPEYAKMLSSVGVNRVSLGLQSVNDTILKRIGRRHDTAQFVRSVEILRSVGICNISADLMLGLPGQTTRDVLDAVELVAQLDLPHVSVYALKVEPGTPMYGYEPEDDLVADLYDVAVEELSRRSMARYETSNFCKVGFECRHNVKYWTLCDYLGIGVAAHSLTQNVRKSNPSDLVAYLNGTGYSVTDRTTLDEKTEFVMLALRMERGLLRKEYIARFGVDFVSEHHAAVGRLQRLGCLQCDEDRVRIAPKYAFVANSVIVELIDEPND